MNSTKPACYLRTYQHTSPPASDYERAAEFVIQSVFRKPLWADSVQSAATALMKAVPGRARPNPTGNKADVQVKVGDVKYTLHFCPYEGRREPRTIGLMKEEAMKSFAKSFFQKNDLIAQFLKTAAVEKNHVESKLGLTVYIHHVSWEVRFLMDLEVLLAGKPNAIDAAVSEAFQFIQNGGLNKKFSKHQTKRAYSVLKEGAIHAFQHGGDFDEMVTILREALTEVVMSS